MVWLMCTKTRRQVFICTTRHRRCRYGKDSRIDFNEKPITIEPPADYCENENVIDYKSMTVPELKAYAAELGIDLGSASKKDAIIQEIVDAVAVEDTTSETEV